MINIKKTQNSSNVRRVIFASFSICLLFSIQGCNNQSVTNQQPDSSIEKEETIISKDTIVIGLEKWYEGAKDTTINMGNKQIYVKIEIAAIPDKFVIYGTENIVKIADTEINIQISNHKYKLQKQDIPNLDEFLDIFVFQRIDFHSFTEEAVTFEITIGELDTCNVVFVFLTIDLEGNKSLIWKFPEWDEDE